MSPTRNIMVIDIGAGTTDICLAVIQQLIANANIFHTTILSHTSLVYGGINTIETIADWLRKTLAAPAHLGPAFERLLTQTYTIGSLGDNIQSTLKRWLKNKAEEIIKDFSAKLDSAAIQFHTAEVPPTAIQPYIINLRGLFPGVRRSESYDEFNRMLNIIDNPALVEAEQYLIPPNKIRSDAFGNLIQSDPANGNMIPHIISLSVETYAVQYALVWDAAVQKWQLQNRPELLPNWPHDPVQQNLRLNQAGLQPLYPKMLELIRYVDWICFYIKHTSQGELFKGIIFSGMASRNYFIVQLFRAEGLALEIEMIKNPQAIMQHQHAQNVGNFISDPDYDLDKMLIGLGLGLNGKDAQGNYHPQRLTPADTMNLFENVVDITLDPNKVLIRNTDSFLAWQMLQRPAPEKNRAIEIFAQYLKALYDGKFGTASRLLVLNFSKGYLAYCPNWAGLATQQPIQIELMWPSTFVNMALPDGALTAEAIKSLTDCQSSLYQLVQEGICTLQNRGAYLELSWTDAALQAHNTTKRQILERLSQDMISYNLNQPRTVFYNQKIFRYLCEQKYVATAMIPAPDLNPQDQFDQFSYLEDKASPTTALGQIQRYTDQQMQLLQQIHRQHNKLLPDIRLPDNITALKIYVALPLPNCLTIWKVEKTEQNWNHVGEVDPRPYNELILHPFYMKQQSYRQ